MASPSNRAVFQSSSTESTNEIVTTAAHADLEVKEEESHPGSVAVESTHHTEHSYSGPVTKETIGHPAIEVLLKTEIFGLALSIPYTARELRA